ncbi:DUF4134 family protein [Mucilaginibacter rigui]|uniref:DUF4134 family protein n=1 Tax=Mucilaginibacter rigui TaxID=534635 RepID=A0ABR7X5N7_9SPHI|nr:DUF4134 family protein [Mucilaginibacter rigui]MBD1385870.1 DUF4134 family protein [Mucilaginibacter rigui]
MRALITFACCLLAVGGAAQPGIPEMQQAQRQLTSDFFSMSDLSLVLAIILGLNGASKIYYNWQNGKPQIDSDVAAWFYAALFMVLAGAFLKALFGI